eukprot:TRINITY_DN13817_c0_g1_i1.p1 TRINITY_DN13817_c0_g1~~TRINITY_DN13817_c0_g1_i1.p1  ORF type:complete len:232 (-),score=33.63 TRINITY_DN13817_c0_g1_i1:36-731(-)
MYEYTSSNDGITVGKISALTGEGYGANMIINLNSKCPYDGELTALHVYTYSKFYNYEWMAYTLEPQFDQNNLSGKKMNKNSWTSESYKYRVIGKHELTDNMEIRDKPKNQWAKFQLQKPIPIKKDHFFSLCNKSMENCSFAYFTPDDEHKRSHHTFQKADLPKEKDILSFKHDQSYLCYYYSMQLNYKYWDEKSHQNYPLSFKKSVPVILYYLKKKNRIPRVLVYLIIRMF